MRKLMMAAAVALGLSLPATADELRLGVYQHDVDVLGIGAAGKEDGQDLAIQWDFGKPDALKRIWNPSVFVMGSVNLKGDTNFASTGLAWEFRPDWFHDNLYFRPSFGLAIHDGYADLPPVDASTQTPAEVARRVALRDTEIEFGSRVLFQTAFAFGWDLDAQNAIELSYLHLSHGQILASGPNEGLDNLGLRYVRRFGQ